MSSVNQEYLAEQFQMMEEYLRRARRVAALSRQDYLADSTAVDASVRQLTVLFETSHNIAKHLGSRFGWRTPSSKAEGDVAVYHLNMRPMASEVRLLWVGRR